MHRFMNDEDIAQIHAAIDERRSEGSYVPGKWSVSAFNRDPEVLGGAMPRSVTIRDITLRTAEQAHGAPLSNYERARLAEALIDAGLRSLQVTFAGWSSTKDQLNALGGLAYDGELTLEAVVSREQIKRAADAGIHVAQLMNPSIPGASPIYLWQTYDLAWRGEDWRSLTFPKSTQDQVDHAAELIACAHDEGIKASAGINLLSYATDDYLDEYCSGVVAAGADQITVYDGTGGMGPEAWSHVVRKVRQIHPDGVVVVHPHNTFGLAAANALAAVHAGADVVEVSVNHLCSASGQADLAEVVAGLEVLYGVSTGVKMNRLTGLSRLVQDLTRIRMSELKPLTGEYSWAYNNEMVVQEQAVEQMLHYSAMPEVFGNEKRFFIGKASGPWSMLDKLDEWGIQVERENVGKILDEVKDEMHLRKRVLSEVEVKRIASKYSI